MSGSKADNVTKGRAMSVQSFHMSPYATIKHHILDFENVLSNT